MVASEITDDMTAAQVIALLHQHWGLKSDADIAKELSVERGSIAQFKRRKGSADLPMKIIIALLRDVEYLETKLNKDKQTAVLANLDKNKK